MAKVLIVEDQPSVATVVQYHVEQAGFETTQAGDAEAAWHHLVSEAPDAAVVDIKLPGADGWSFIERVRNDGRFSNLPIVVLTGLLEADVVMKAEQMRCGYLSKPFAASALVNKIEAQVKGAAPKPPPLDHLTDPSAQAVPQQTGPLSPTLPQKVDLITLRVIVLMNGYQVEGDVHIPPELGRFSDAWEALMKDHRDFIPMTDAIVMVGGAQPSTARSSFLQIRKTDVMGIFPKET